MQTYKPPLRSASTASLSFLLGIVVIVAITLSLRVADNNRLSKKADLVSKTVPVDPSISETQLLIQNDREQKLRNRIPAEQKTITETKPVTAITTAPASQATTPAPATKKSDRTTKTS